MLILTPEGWQDYELLDSGGGQRLERFGPATIVRPDPQAIWQPLLPQIKWKQAQAVFDQHWKITGQLPERWLMNYQNLKFWAKLTPFKHTGLFPEQAVQWQWIQSRIAASTSSPRNDKPVRVLNLFAYTGLASLAAAAAGAEVTHLDASRSSIGWAKDNQLASGLEHKPIRWILDDAIKFCQREVRRGKKYHGIMMDPPAYGHGPAGEVWKFNESFPQLMSLCQQLLADDPLFLLVNAYAISASALMLENVIQDTVGKLGGTIEVGELALQQTNSTRLLSTGIFGRWAI